MAALEFLEFANSLKNTITRYQTHDEFVARMKGLGVNWRIGVVLKGAESLDFSFPGVNNRIITRFHATGGEITKIAQEVYSLEPALIVHRKAFDTTPPALGELTAESFKSTDTNIDFVPAATLTSAFSIYEGPNLRSKFYNIGKGLAEGKVLHYWARYSRAGNLNGIRVMTIIGTLDHLVISGMLKGSIASYRNPTLCKGINDHLDRAKAADEREHLKKLAKTKIPVRGGKVEIEGALFQAQVDIQALFEQAMEQSRLREVASKLSHPKGHLRILEDQ